MLAYLRTTQTYKWARDQAGYFIDPAWVNHEDAVFANYYFSAYDSWAGGDRSHVPAAWLTALDSARDHTVTSSGDLLLGMNAHINRDLPLVLAAIGTTAPDGTSHRPDHDKVDEFLRAVLPPLIAELAARLDSDIVTIRTPFGVGPNGLFQQLLAWRKTAWQNAVLLTNAPTPQARANLLQEIERTAANQAQSIVAANRYVVPGTSSAPREAYCALHNTAPPPAAYPFGTATAY